MVPVSGLATQGVVSPVTDHAGVQMAAPIPAEQQAAAPAPQMVLHILRLLKFKWLRLNQLRLLKFFLEESNKSSISLVPHFGISSMSTNNSIFTVNSGFSAGVDLDLPITENVAFELGYTYNQYGVDLPGYGSSYYGGYDPIYGSQDTFTLKQNVINAGIKAHVLGADYKFRPFVSGGGGYAMSSLNFPDQGNMVPSGYQPQPYNSNAFVAYVGAGFDEDWQRTSPSECRSAITKHCRRNLRTTRFTTAIAPSIRRPLTLEQVSLNRTSTPLPVTALSASKRTLRRYN